MSDEAFEPFEKRRVKFHEEYVKLVAKYRVDFMAVLQPTRNSLDAQLSIVDTLPNPESEHITN